MSLHLATNRSYIKVALIAIAILIALQVAAGLLFLTSRQFRAAERAPTDCRYRESMVGPKMIRDFPTVREMLALLPAPVSYIKGDMFRSFVAKAHSRDRREVPMALRVAESDESHVAHASETAEKLDFWKIREHESTTYQAVFGFEGTCGMFTFPPLLRFVEVGQVQLRKALLVARLARARP